MKTTKVGFRHWFVSATALAVVVLLLVTGAILTGCDSAGAGGEATPAVTPESNAASAFDAVWSAIGVRSIGYFQNALPGVGGGVIDDQGSYATQDWTFTNVVDPLTGYTLNGSLTFTITDMTNGMSIIGAGTIALSGTAPVSDLVIAGGFTLDGSNNTITGSGTITVDDKEYDLSTFDTAGGKAGEHTPLLMGVWAGTESTSTPWMKLFILPGNFAVPIAYDSGTYGGGGNPVAFYFDSETGRFLSNDGTSWFSSGGFSTDGDTMTFSSGSPHGYIMVFNPADSSTSVDSILTGAWNHQAWMKDDSAGHYDNITFDLAEGANASTITGYYDAGSNPPNEADMQDVTATITLTTTEVTIADSGVFDNTFGYTTMGNSIILSLGDDDPRMFVFTRK